MIFVIIALIVIAIVLIATNIRIIPQSHAAVIERLGAYCKTWQVGIHIKIPFIDRIATKISLKEKVLDLHLCGSLKQRFISFCYNYISNLYISIRYLLATKKFH